MINKNVYFLCLIYCFVLLNGCATIGPSVDNTAVESAQQSDEIPKSVRISEFILGVGDKVEITVYRQSDLTKTVQIDLSGKITYPLVGDIQAAGLSVFQLRDLIKDKLKKFFIAPQVSVSVTTVQSQKIVVLGEVKNPGFFTLDVPLTTLEAVSKAGGFTNDAKKKNVLIIRGNAKKPQVMTLNVEKIFGEQDMAQNVSLQSGDIIYVPTILIANISRYADHLTKILSPILMLESIYYIGQQIHYGEGGNSEVILPAK